MPKGHYQRRSKVIEAMAEPAVPPAVIPHTDDMIIGGAVMADPVPEHDAEMHRIASLLTEPTPPMPVAPPHESFDEWLDADAPVMPANDRITQMVGEWAASFCLGEHFVTWLPSPDTHAIVVTLVTEHGTSELAKPAGQWREADIAEALAAMRADLGV